MNQPMWPNENIGESHQGAVRDDCIYPGNHFHPPACRCFDCSFLLFYDGDRRLTVAQALGEIRNIR